MDFTKAIERIFKKYLPSPFTLAVLLTLLTILLALLLIKNTEKSWHLTTVLSYWEDGIWNNGLLVFAYQMMLILVLGHVLVLSKPMGKLILRLTGLVKDSAGAAVLVALSTMLVSFFNWGLGLIFGAILARKVGEHAHKNNIPVNYPLIGAAGYVGLMVWHGGISGSAPLKVSEAGHLHSLMKGVSKSHMVLELPDFISTSETIFSPMNIVVFIVLLISISILAYRLGKKAKPTNWDSGEYNFSTPGVDSGSRETPAAPEHDFGESLDRSGFFAMGFGILILATFLVQYSEMMGQLNITPNMLNFFMLGLALLMHGSFKNFLKAVEMAIGDVSGILIQFPLYFGIMGIMAGSGMIDSISDFFVSISNRTTLPIFTFFSAGMVNIFVPSGGGQWAVQGPMIIESALKLDIPLSKAVMALAYGDQVTNMLQPFWALPLLGITKLKAKEILPYTILFMLVGGSIYLLGLFIF
ncbi:short-chain fatty acid transporter [Maribacter algicola]|uniref:Short-chain fatty acid transporter n=1 Tax=Meishania litoralis TaxID=3434685 RepID=A0ACC7LI36_9FLAO